MASNQRVLLVDDDDLVAVALYEHLAASAIAVDLATDVARAEALIRARRYDIVVIDAYMTGMLGERAAALLQMIARLCPDAQIVLLSAYGSEEFARSVESARPITLLQKPQSVVHVGHVIAGLMNGVPA